jgi:hypothetical protein
MFRNVILIIVMLVSPSVLWAGTDDVCPTEAGKPTQVFSQADMDASGSYTMSRDTVWHFSGRVHVKAGQTLYVQSGTIIKGTGPGDLHPTEPSALIIDRDGYAEMLGDSCCPIVMTYLYDNVDDPADMPHGNASRGLWGGLIILGYANIGDCGTHTGEVERHIEGIPETAWDYDNVIYGCDGNCDDNDNSGIYGFISIRHGGHEIGEANEINGLTMGAVGAGTEIHHIEVYHNLDDGFEWFGGTVNTRYLVSAFNGDDAFDYDQGFRGYGQHWFAILDDDGDNVGEHDGNEDPEDACPFARPNIANVTYMGPGEGASGAANSQVLKVRDNAGGHYSNSIFIDFPQKGLSIEDLDPPANPCGVPGGTEDSEKRLAAGDLTFSSIFFWNFAGLTTDGCANVLADRAIISGSQTWIEQYVFDDCNAVNPNNCIQDPDLVSYPPTKGTGAACRTLQSHTLCPRPSLTSPVHEDNGAVLDPLTRPADGQAYPGEGPTDLAAPSWYVKVPYAGAFDPYEPSLWTDCWTILGFGGYTQPTCVPGDADESGFVDIDDVVYLINYIFGGGPAPTPALCCGDADGSGFVDIDDVVYEINYIFGGGPAPVDIC